MHTQKRFFEFNKSHMKSFKCIYCLRLKLVLLGCYSSVYADLPQVSFSIGQLFSRFFITDLFGRKTVLFTSLLLISLLGIKNSLTTSFNLFLLERFFLGIIREVSFGNRIKVLEVVYKFDPLKFSPKLYFIKFVLKPFSFYKNMNPKHQFHILLAKRNIQN